MGDFYLIGAYAGRFRCRFYFWFSVTGLPFSDYCSQGVGSRYRSDFNFSHSFSGLVGLKTIPAFSSLSFRIDFLIQEEKLVFHTSVKSSQSVSPCWNNIVFKLLPYFSFLSIIILACSTRSSFIQIQLSFSNFLSLSSLLFWTNCSGLVELAALDSVKIVIYCGYLIRFRWFLLCFSHSWIGVACL